MASFQKVYLRVVGRVGDTAIDVDELPDRVMATGNIFLKPNVKDGWAEQVTGPDGREELMLPAPIQCTIEDGMMTYNGQPHVWLVVGEENWNWNISFPLLRISNVVRKIDAFNFDIEPATEEQIEDELYEGINLAELQEFTDPDTGNKATRGPRGYAVDSATIVSGDQLVFSLDDPMNTSLPPVTIPAVTAANDARDAAILARNAAQTAEANAETAEGNAGDHEDNAEAARDAAISAKNAAEAAAASFDLSEGTTTTLPPGSSATVTVGGVGPTYVLNIGVPQGDEGPVGPPAPDADATTKGIHKLAGDLAGTADAPLIGPKKVTGAKIDDDTITSTQIAPNAITSSELADNSVDTAAVVAKAITAAKIDDNTITALQIAPDAVGSSELANGAVDTAAIATGAVTSNEIADGTLVNADVNSAAAIGLAKLGGKGASFSFVVQGGTRAANAFGDLLVGLYIFQPMVIDSITYQFGTADASGSTTLKCKKNASDMLTSGQAGVTAANQADGSGTDTARTFTPTSNNTFAKGDRFGCEILTVGTTPGKILIVNVEAHWA